MTIYKCKMCGGTLEITEGSSVCTCEFCDTVQTLPTIQDEGLQNLFNRANVLRMKSEFDKAAEIYEKILQKSSEESEAYWGLILCKYGIEYVEDPETYKRIPTCHRASYDSVIADDDYKMALQYADMSQKAIYEEEARVIDEVQKGIIALAQKADPYDVFICYKETDENGQRTQDSVIANDIYYQLTQEGFKVFYAAITLEDKLGSEYEPYIFSALNTAKVLLSIGTKPEYFNAVWVKNEWSRFLKIMKKDRSKMLIPCYKDMDAYELPEEFAHLQAQNMGKIGFINDLVRGIKKVIVKEESNKSVPGTTVVQTTYSSNIQALLDRGHMALEDSEWDKADGFFEEVLNQDAKCAEAYLGKLFADNKVDTLAKYFSKLEYKYLSATNENLYACKEEIEHINSIIKENVLEGYLEANVIRKLYTFDRRYSSALSCRKEQKNKQQAEIDSDKLLIRVRQYTTGELKEQIELGLENLISVLDARIIEEKNADEEKISEISANYQIYIDDTDIKVREMRVKADKEKYSYYESIVNQMKKASTISEYGIVHSKFKELGTYEESFEFAKKCQSEIDRLKEEENKEKARKEKKKKVITTIVSVVIILSIIGVVVTKNIIIPSYRNSITYYRKCGIGDTLYMGKFDGKRIEWIVLAVEGDRLLVVASDPITMMPYNTDFAVCTWENCSLRNWLNNNFYNDVFSTDEQLRILTTSVNSSVNPKYYSDASNATEDKVFLLSIDEVNQYFETEESRKCEYDGNSCCWWLRSPGYDHYHAVGVLNPGSFYYSGYNVQDENVAVRPAMWINLE